MEPFKTNPSRTPLKDLSQEALKEDIEVCTAAVPEDLPTENPGQGFVGGRG